MNELDHSNFNNYLFNNQFQDERNNNWNPDMFEYSKLKEQSLKEQSLKEQSLKNDSYSKPYANISDYNTYEQNIAYPNNLNELIPSRVLKGNMNSALQDNESDKLKGNLN